MNRTFLLLLLGAGLALCFPQLQTPAAEAGVITTGTLLEEMIDLDRLARWPQPAYRTIQFSSYDRRSSSSEAPGWFSNADGFGREPVAGFQKVLREAQGDQRGLYLVAEVKGPGAIARGWSAGMAGVLRVYLDPSAEGSGSGEGTLIWEGPAYDFLARRSSQYLKSADIELDAKDAFSQQDADYFPIPFARGLRVTWEGKLNELHFYHLQVRLYESGTKVRPFDPKQDLKTFQPQVAAAVSGLLKPASLRRGDPTKLEGASDPGRAWT